MPKVTISRKEHFNAAHRLYNQQWSDEKNDAIFGKCNNPNWHGHNYEVIVSLTGEPDPETGFVYDMKKLSDLINELIIEKLDHKNLNLDVTEFQNLNPTAENIAIVIYNTLKPKIEGDSDLKITLYETERNFVEYPA